MAFDGSLLVRIHLRQAARTADAPTSAAIGKALADAHFVSDTASALVDESSAAQLPAGGLLAQFLQMLLANLPAIIALIMQLFGGLVPPAPTPAA